MAQKPGSFTCAVGADDADSRRLVKPEVDVFQDHRARRVLELHVHHLQNWRAQCRNLSIVESSMYTTKSQPIAAAAAAKPVVTRQRGEGHEWGQMTLWHARPHYGEKGTNVMYASGGFLSTPPKYLVTPCCRFLSRTRIELGSGKTFRFHRGNFLS